MFMVPFGKVKKDYPCPLDVTVLFCASTFHYNPRNVVFIIPYNCPTNEDVIYMCLKSLYQFFIKKIKIVHMNNKENENKY